MSRRAAWAALALLLAAAPPAAAAPIEANVAVESYALVERAPVRSGFAPFAIEATRLLPAPRPREDFTPSEDQVVYPMRRTVERVLARKESPLGWSRSNEASLSFASEIDAFSRDLDGLAYAIEGELALHGDKPIPLGLRLSAGPPEPGVTLRYAVGLMVADQTVLTRDGIIDGKARTFDWMLSLRPSGPDAAVPVRAVFAVRAESADRESARRALKGLRALILASSDGRPAVAERAKDAAEWLKPLRVYLRPDQIAAPPGGEDAKKGDKKDAKKAEGGSKH